MLPFQEFMSLIRFVIVSPEPNIARLKDTVRSVRNNFGEVEVVCSVAKSVKKAQLDEMKGVCDSFRGGETVMSLINAGLKRGQESRWNVLVMEGARVPRGLEYRYRRWIEDENDVIFPIVMQHDLEGRPMIHSSMFKRVGPFSDNPIGISKRFWGLDAEEKGARFKAVLGVKII